jgi:murein DD-endopeptidase MepM/ murein hydrolase activator NlpD
MPERARVHPVREAVLATKNGLTFKPSRLPSILGNHVILRSGDIFAGLAHLAPGSVEVAEGQRVSTGDILGRVGHSGNSTSPHLHFQLMDSADLMAARGIACAFRAYEVERQGTWVRVTDAIPGRRERLRSVEPDAARF